MTDKNTFNLPDVGEGLTEADIVSWRVAEGDNVKINDVIVEIETAKSLVELPSPFEGTVTQLLAQEGKTLDVGEPLIEIQTHVKNTQSSSKKDDKPADKKQVDHKEASEDKVDNTTNQNLVGTGPQADGERPQKRKSKSQISSNKSVLDENSKVHQRVLAKPPIRKVAKDLGVNIHDVVGTGPRSEVTRQDLLDYIQTRDNSQNVKDAQGGFWTGQTEHINVAGIRKATAKAMVKSAFNAPHVSIFVDVDASRTMEFVKKLKSSRDYEGIKVTPLLILAKAVIWAAERNPEVNASWKNADGSGEVDEILIHHFMNLGIAAATDRGLVVPNIKNAQNLSLKELSIALNDLATKARQSKTSPEDMSNGTLTITNIGALGIDTGTPIINPGEVAIIAFGTIKQKPWVLDGEVLPRWVTTLGGSFDHRVVDGDHSARFMADVASVLEEPALLLD